MFRRLRSRGPETLVALGLLVAVGTVAGILVERRLDRAPSRSAVPVPPATTAVPPSTTTAAPTPAPPPTPTVTTETPPSPAAPAGLQVTALTPLTATIAWQTAQPTVGRIAFGPSALGETRWLPPTPAATDHVATLTGLTFSTAYHVTVSSTTPAGERDAATVDLTTPGPVSAPTPSVGGGAVLLDGQPWFPLMVYGQCSTLYDSSIETGITLFAANPCGGLEAQVGALPGRALSAAVSGDATVSGPGVIGTFYPDEADDHGFTGATLPPVPTGLGFLTLTNHFYSGAAPLTHGRTVYPSLVAKADVVGFDLYPLQGWCRRNRLADVYTAQRELVSLARGKPTFQWIETAGMNCPTDPVVAVTPDTVRAESWLAIAGGAHGLGFFPAAWTGDVGGAITKVRSEVAAVFPAVLRPQVPSSASVGSIVTAAWELDGALYVVGINTGTSPVDATLRVAGLASRVAERARRGAVGRVVRERPERRLRTIGRSSVHRRAARRLGGRRLTDRLVQHRTGDGSHARPDDVDPEVAPLPADQRRPERPRRVHRGARDTAAEECVQRDGAADRDGCARADRTRVGRDGDDHEHQEQRQNQLVHEGRAGPTLGTVAPSRAGESRQTRRRRPAPSTAPASCDGT